MALRVIDVMEKIENIETAMKSIHEYMGKIHAGSPALSGEECKNILENLKGYKRYLRNKKVEGTLEGDL